MGQNNGPSGKRYRRGYRLLIKAGVENAMAKGFLFGRPLDKTTKKVIITGRGNVIWPDPPQGMMKKWWRAHQTGQFLGEPIPHRS